MDGDLFDSTAEFLIDRGSRPHWSQNKAIVFVTFRTKDSIPKSVLKQWNQEKVDWLLRKGVKTGGKDIPSAVAKLSIEHKKEFRKQFNRKREDFLDQGYGECVLSNPQLSNIVKDSILRFDGDRYHIIDFVIMPNHVHLLAAFQDAESMRKQIAAWLHYTAKEINFLHGMKGHFWQQEPFDHLVRSAKQLKYLRRYIEENPIKAGLKSGEYLYYKVADRSAVSSKQN